MDPLILVIFGASGDLTERKLIPAVYNLFKSGMLPEHFAVLGVSRTAFTDDAFRDKVVAQNEHLKAKDGNPDQLRQFAQKLHYHALDTAKQSDYEGLRDRLDALNQEQKTKGNYLFYLSTPPSLYSVIPEHLAHYGLADESKGWRRLIIEKPFGYDLSTAKQLNRDLLKFFKEDQIYRIDHYLGKETVQNMLVTRFSNGIFEPLWNRNYIHHIEVTSAENIGVENRGGYYDTSGAMRDMVQNHLLQLVAHVAMEPPVTADAYSVRNEKLKLFQSIRPIREKEVDQYVIRGQYVSSRIRGNEVIGYREEQGVGKDSRTETYVAMKFFIDNWRWSGVPFYIRTGKRLPTKVTEVVVYFKSPPQALFHKVSGAVNGNNLLVIRIQPNEGILLKFGMKVPGAGFKVQDVGMDFLYSELADAYIPEAYERLLLDCMQGDATLYARGDSVEATWDFIDPILKAWEDRPDIPLFGYPGGTWGPENADQLIEEKDITWRYPCKNLADDGAYCEL